MSADFSIFALAIFLVKFHFKKCFKIFFFRFGVEIGCGAAISDAVARSSIVFRNSVSADRIVVAASRLLGVAAACVVILLSLQLDLVNSIGVAASRLRQ